MCTRKVSLRLWQEHLSHLQSVGLRGKAPLTFQRVPLVRVSAQLKDTRQRTDLFVGEGSGVPTWPSPWWETLRSENVIGHSELVFIYTFCIRNPKLGYCLGLGCTEKKKEKSDHYLLNSDTVWALCKGPDRTKFAQSHSVCPYPVRYPFVLGSDKQFQTRNRFGTPTNGSQEDQSRDTLTEEWREKLRKMREPFGRGRR